ncbi:MAG TPA: sensor histidine kinase, partial [Ktedonobacteraceae bacterium]|nr:sensor histidine kinase [Ktedonobacteraceae bacterium]
HPAPFVVDDLVRAIIEDLGYPASRLHLEETVQAQAYGDQERTGQVVRNLLINALKYSAPTEPVWVRISASEDAITLSVQDHGRGIPQDQQARIFDRFARLDQSERVPGTGLGLYIAAQIVAQQGGRIWVESTPGKGATFFFTLRCAREPASDTVQQARERYIEELPHGKKKSISPNF